MPHDISKPLMLITRPFEDALPLAEQLQNIGCDVWVEPMISIEIKFQQMQSLEDLLEIPPQAIIVTSANGLRALCALTGVRNIRLITVGPASHDEATKQGFTNLDMANPSYGGDVHGLVRHISENYNNTDGMILHISGTITAGDLLKQLKAKDLPANHIALYDATAAENLSTTVQNKFEQNSISGIMFYSPRTAEIFIELMTEADLLSHLHTVNCFCLSQNVANKFKDINFKNTFISKNPTQDDMLLLIKSEL